MNHTVLTSLDELLVNILAMECDKGVDRTYYQNIYAEIKKHMGPDCATIFANNVHSEDGIFWFESEDDVLKMWDRMMKNIAT